MIIKRTGGRLPGRGARRVVSGILAVALAVAVAGCGDDDAGSEDPEELYSGATIEIIVPFGAGGSSDLLARFLAPYLSKHLPGEPTVQVINVEANGDHRVGTHQFADADPDGLTLLMGSGSTHSAYLYESPGVRYDLGEYTPLMAFPLGNVIFVRPNTGIQTAEDLLSPATTLYSGGREPVGGDLYRVSAYHVLGMEVEELWGYEGRSQMQVAFEQDELNVGGETTPTYLANVQPLVDAGEATPVFTLGQIEGPDLVRDPAFPDLPHVGEVYEILHGQPADTLGLEWEAYKLQVAAALTVSKSLWVHGETPEPVQQALLDAAAAIATDADFATEAEAELGGYGPVVGDALDEAITTHLQSANEEAIEWLRNDVNERYGIGLE
jgi:tripartite-type tricarboxylate transporter receptor subunit TctC